MDDSSCRDALLGFSRSGNRSVPPDFCAAADVASDASMTTTSDVRAEWMGFIVFLRFRSCSPQPGSGL
jgi:hypothetical protein